MIKKTSLCICMLMIFCLMAIPSSEKKHFIVGSEEGEGLLIYPRYVKEGPEGNIYVYDSSDAYIKVYSPDGKYLKRIGGKGQGPGEIQRADGANFGFTHDGKLYFTETFGGHRWITIMELSGEFHKAIHPEINEVFGIADSFPLKDGGFLVEFWFAPKPEKKEDYFLYQYPQSLIWINPEGSVISEIVKTNYLKTISSISDGGDQWIPFFPGFEWIPFKENMAVFADGLSPNLKVYDYNGILIREIKTALPEPQKVTSKDLDEWRRSRKEEVRDESWWSRFGRVVEKYKKSIYDKKPNLRGISSTPEGNILVSCLSREDEKTEYWLINENGKTIAHVSLDCGMVRISKDFLFFSTIDEEENYLIHCLKRSETEGKDLLSLEGIDWKVR